MNSFQCRIGSLCFIGLAVWAFAFDFGSPVLAQEVTKKVDHPIPLEPSIAPASGDAQQAIKQFKLLSNLDCQLFVAEPDVANIVAFYRDFQGNMYVCETFRQPKNAGVEDNRDHPYWLVDDLKAQSVADRVDYIRKHIEDADKLYTQHDDRIRLIKDQNGDGVADHSHVFADRFNQLAMGTGADVLAYKGAVYYTCIPDLFKLADTTGDGIADQRQSLHTGYGVRFAFRGHDLHGLVIGPDRRLYFSIGDRGYNISPDIFDPASGAVFRCELDGSQLEVIATGLRNPQNLAFDNYGNLFTCDNNSDSGDVCRWSYIIPGGDSGWRMSYQYLPDRGPFNREKIWHAFHEHSPAYIVPPVANISDGPSGLDFYPGTGFGDTFNDTFLLCDFRGTSFNSGVRSIKNEPVGAFWKMAEDGQPIWGILTTDLQFASDGRLYVSDWVNGWYGEGTGRIYAFTDPSHVKSEIVVEVEKLLREGMTERATDELLDLLKHQDRRVRQEAQFELVDRNCLEELKLFAAQQQPLLARLHAIWGLEILIRCQPRGEAVNVNVSGGVETSGRQSAIAWMEFLTQLLSDRETEIRAYATQLAAQLGPDFKDLLLTKLQDDDLRVRYFASMALTNMSDVTCIEPVALMLAENDDRDPVVRHGGVMLLKSIIDPYVLGNDGFDHEQLESVLKTLCSHHSPSVRLAASVAIRKILDQPGVDRDQVLPLVSSAFVGLLEDQDGRVGLEVARAIYDLPVIELMPQLAATTLFLPDGQPRLNPGFLQQALVGRVIQANLRTAGQEQAERLMMLAQHDGIELKQRIAALSALIDWTTPTEIDPLNHTYFPLDVRDRDLENVRSVFEASFDDLISGPTDLAATVIVGAGKLGLKNLEPKLAQLTLSTNIPSDQRTRALVSLNQIQGAQLDPVVEQLRKQFADSPDEFPLDLLIQLGTVSSRVSEQSGLDILAQIADNQQLPKSTRQQSIRSIGKFEGILSRDWLLNKLKQVANQTVEPELRLDVVVAAKTRNEPELQQAAAAYFDTLKSAEDPSAVYVDSLVGGNFDKGRSIFETKTEVSCIRCHRVDAAETAVGPYLGEIGLKRDRQHLLDSIVQPNKDISEGFGQIKVQTIDGLMFTGLLVEESDEQLKLLDAEGNTEVIPRDDIDDIKPGLSSMPLDIIDNLTHDELRDLVEYLYWQRGDGSGGSNANEHR